MKVNNLMIKPLPNHNSIASNRLDSQHVQEPLPEVKLNTQLNVVKKFSNFNMSVGGKKQEMDMNRDKIKEMFNRAFQDQVVDEVIIK